MPLPTPQIKPISAHGKWWLEVTIGDQRLLQKRSYPSADEANAAAAALTKEWTPNLPTASTNDTVILHGRAVELTSDEGRKFVVDCTRAGEKLVSDSELQEKYEITPENWAQLEKNRSLIKAIRDERTRRVRNGQAAREAAAQHFVKAPTVLDNIMSDAKASPRHRIEAAREIRQVAIGGDSTESHVDASDRFIININLGADETIKIEVPPEDIRRNNAKQIEGEIDAGE